MPLLELFAFGILLLSIDSSLIYLSASGDLANTVQVAETDVISNTDCQAVWGNRIDTDRPGSD